MATWQLVEPIELSWFLGRPVADDKAFTALRVAAGWIQGATGLADWAGLVGPDGRLPDDLWAWTLELAGYALDNPTSLAERNDGEARRAWEPRRAEILSAARERFGAAGTGGTRTGTPLFSFPPATWPEARPVTRYVL